MRVYACACVRALIHNSKRKQQARNQRQFIHAEDACACARICQTFQTERRGEFLRPFIDIWRTQDAFLAEWPRYEEVEGQLARQLQAQLGVEQMTVEDDAFGQLVGCPTCGTAVRVPAAARPVPVPQSPRAEPRRGRAPG